MNESDRRNSDVSTINESEYVLVHPRPLLITSVVIALVSGAVIVADSISPQYPWTMLLVFCAGVSLETSLTLIWLSKGDRSVNPLAMYAAEGLIVVLLLRILTWLLQNTFPSLNDIPILFAEPERLLDQFFVISTGIVLISLFFSRQITGMFVLLSPNRSEISYAKASRKDVNRIVPVMLDRQGIKRRYYQIWATGALFLIIFTAISTFDLAGIENSPGTLSAFRTLDRIGLEPGMLAALLVYFMGGLWMAGDCKLAILNARWIYEGLPIEPDVSRSWRRYRLLLLAIIALIASFFPIGSTFALAEIVQAVLWAVFLVGTVIVALVSAIFYLLFGALMNIGEREALPPIDFDNLAPSVPTLNPPTADFLYMLLIGVFWTLLLASIIFAIIYFVRNRGIKLRPSTIKRMWKAFHDWLTGFWRLNLRAITEIGAALIPRHRRIELEGFSIPTRWRFMRPGSLPPRERIRYFYLSIVRRAGESGVIRRAAETPFEYRLDLKENWPDVSKEIDDLTDAFIRARYSRQMIEESEAGSIKSLWWRVRRAVQRRLSN